MNGGGKRTAWITLRIAPPYRSWAFSEGLQAVGFTPRAFHPTDKEISPGDVVVVWNLSPRYRTAAELARKHGCPLLVAENGYIGKAGDSTPYYALARDGHNGSGFWFMGAEDRWSPLGHRLAPWRINDGGHYLVIGQRGIGSDLMKSPHNFTEMARERLLHSAKKLGIPVPAIVIREHPGMNVGAAPPLRDQMAGARGVVTWASNVANLSLLMGIPAVRMAPYHVNDAVFTTVDELMTTTEEPDRLSGFKALAWAQWSLEELGSGLAFRTLLQDVL